MKRIGIIANTSKPHAAEVLIGLSGQADSLGMTLVASGPEAKMLPRCVEVTEKQLPGEIDVMLALGGDGTMLNAVRTLGEHEIPVVGINLGSLGFMTSVPLEDAEKVLDVLSKGDFTVSERVTADCELFRSGISQRKDRALNDIVIGWGASSRVVTLKLSVSDAHVTSYVCDGLIVSTPTGSTGHSLSAGGAILHPETAAFMINVICAHTLTTRPLVIPDDRPITIEVTESPKTLLLSVDGQEEQPVELGDRLEIKRSKNKVRFLHLPGYSYFSVLRQKLHWSGSSM